MITKGDKPNTQKVVFKSTSAKVTKEAAIKALGKKKDRYVVEALKPAATKKAS